MATLVLDPLAEAELRSWRRGDRYDEVWEGITVMSPLPNNQHLDFVLMLATAFVQTVRQQGRGKAYPGVNVSDRAEGWTENYRCPDVAVYLAGNPAVDRGTYMQGGPDLAVEVVSPGENPLAKLAFYAAVGTRELLVVYSEPWSLALFTLSDGALGQVGRVSLGDSEPLTSAALGMTFRLVAGGERPRVEVAEPATGRTWLA